MNIEITILLLTAASVFTFVTLATIRVMVFDRIYGSSFFSLRKNKNHIHPLVDTSTLLCEMSISFLRL